MIVNPDLPTKKVLKFYYDAEGRPIYFDLNGTTYFYVTNLQGDVVALTDSYGEVVSYQYDAWGKPLATDYISSAVYDAMYYNPLRYRGYIYDAETGFYYLQSRYYDPVVGRFISSDGIGYLGATETFLSFNLFAYCENNPVMGYDPTGYWDLGGVIVGVGIIAGTAITIATFGIGSPVGAVIAGAAITTGAVLTYAAATDSAMVLDLSCSGQISGSTYGKGGVSIVIDFDEDEVNLYAHGGGGCGYSSGVSYSAGIVSNYEDPQDYAGNFVDVFGGYNFGVDHCWTPEDGPINSTQATCMTFSSGVSCGAGYDYYLDPIQIAKW